jgi:hypothetical protein
MKWRIRMQIRGKMLGVTPWVCREAVYSWVLWGSVESFEWQWVDAAGHKLTGLVR